MRRMGNQKLTLHDSTFSTSCTTSIIEKWEVGSLTIVRASLYFFTDHVLTRHLVPIHLFTTTGGAEQQKEKLRKISVEELSNHRTPGDGKLTFHRDEMK